MEFDTAYYWAISKNMDATFFLDLAQRKGIGEGLGTRYVRKHDSFGQFYTTCGRNTGKIEPNSWTGSRIDGSWTSSTQNT